MQNFKNGKVPLADNKASSLMKLAAKELAVLYSENELEAINFWLLEHFSGITRNIFLKDPDVNVNQSSIIHFCNAVEKMTEGTPIQYVIGAVDFYGLKLKVNGSVLIPRPETEELVDLIIKQNKDQADLRILDIGTGSGCIALSLAKNFKDPVVYAVDVSANALDIAKINATNNHLKNVEFFEMDILKEKSFGEREFDIIVSNPPYIASSESRFMGSNVVEFEPHQALFVPDDDPLIFYREIGSIAHKNLKRKGLIYVEINERLGNETASIFTKEDFSSVEIMNDMSGKNRFIKAVRL